MKTRSKKTIGTSAKITGITKCINDYFYSENYSIDEKNMKIKNPEELLQNKVNMFYFVSKRNNKYYFSFEVKL